MRSTHRKRAKTLLKRSFKGFICFLEKETQNKKQKVIITCKTVNKMPLRL
jgi:hypothetical protein